MKVNSEVIVSYADSINRTEREELELVRAYWAEKRGDRLMPARREIDPLDIIPALPNVIIIEVQRDPVDFLYRLIGTEVDKHSTQSYTGHKVSEIPHRAPPSTVWENLMMVTKEKTPSCQRVPYVGPGYDFTETRQVLLPLSDDGTTVDHLLAVIVYLRKTDIVETGESFTSSEGPASLPEE